MSVEKGKWYVDKHSSTHARVLVYVEEVKKDYLIGYGIDNRYKWQGPGNKWYHGNLSHLVEASKDEVLERLKKFAIDQGYVEGITLIGSLSLSLSMAKNTKVDEIISWNLDVPTTLSIEANFSGFVRHLMVHGKWLPFTADSVLNDLNEEPVVQESGLIFKCL
jgi:hypothetical protein